MDAVDRRRPLVQHGATGVPRAGARSPRRFVLGACVAAALVLGGVSGAFLFPRSTPPGTAMPAQMNGTANAQHGAAEAEQTSTLAALRTRQLQLHREVEAKWDVLRVAEDELRAATREVERLDDGEARRMAAREAADAVKRELLARELAELKAEATAASGFERGDELGPLFWELVRVREWNAKFQVKEPVSRWADGSVEGPSGLLPLPKHREHVAEKLRSIAGRFGPNSRIARGWARALAEIEERIARASAPPAGTTSSARRGAEMRVAEVGPLVEAARTALEAARADLRAVEDKIAALGEKP